MAPRAIWSGDVTFGLATIPVKLYSATDAGMPEMNYYQAGTADRVRLVKVNERTGERVTETVKGYSADGGPLVQLTDDDLTDALPGKSREITVERFVDMDDIDPIYFDRTYYLAPAKNGRAYALVAAVLGNTARAAIVTFTMRDRQHLAAIRARHGRLVMHTLHYAESVRSADDLPAPSAASVSPSDPAYLAALDLIDALNGDWRPADYRNEHRARLLAMVAEKRAQTAVEPVSEPTQGNDLGALLDALSGSMVGAA